LHPQSRLARCLSVERSGIARLRFSTPRLNSDQSYRGGAGLLNIAHRGASGSFPENTIRAFQAAADAGAAMCELDVRLTRDGVPVVIHDATVDRTTGSRGAVAEMTLAEIRRLDAGVRCGAHFAGEPIPTLAEVFEALGDRCALNIELKADGLERPVCAMIRARGAIATAMVSSFDWAALARIKAIDAEVRIGVLADRDGGAMLAAARRLGAWAVNPRYNLCTPELVTAAHRQGFQVMVWTVDDVAAMRCMIGYGVDGIMTNYPERLSALVG